MSEIGQGRGSSYPNGLDTDHSPETTNTKARPEVPNDLAAAIIAAQTELGTNPAGSYLNVKNRLNGNDTLVAGICASLVGTQVEVAGICASLVGTQVEVAGICASLAVTQADLDGFPDELKNLTVLEIQQLENINLVTISNAQWAWLGGYAIDAKSRAYGDTNQLNIAHNVFTKVALNQETYDPGGYFDAAANYRFVAPVAGYYLVTGVVTWQATVLDRPYYAYIYANGAVYSQASAHASAVYGISITVTDIVPLAATEFVELWARHFGGAATPDIIAGETITYLSVHFLSPV